MTDEDFEAPEEEEEADRQRKTEPPPAIDRDEFLAWRSPREVSGPPIPLDNPLWHWLVRTRESAHAANQAFDGPSPFEAGPGWCFDRFGKSETTLPDGRVVHIGGEHEDHYDPDFFIYNDVTIVHPDGAIAVRGYDRAMFPPTDFHSATCVGDAVFIVGCLGYLEQRVVGSTPVFRLDLGTMDIARVETHGEAPGWIHGHRADLAADGRTLVLRGGEIWLGKGRSMQENIDRWSLDVERGRWTRLTSLDWQRWTMVRVDRRRNRLWDTRQERWHRDNPWPGFRSYWEHAEAPDFEALEALYRLDAASPPPENGSEHNVFLVAVDGVRVRFTEDSWSVQAMVEGRLSDERLDELQRTTLATLARLDASEWEIEPQ